jgi:hypothetical protein
MTAAGCRSAAPDHSLPRTTGCTGHGSIRACLAQSDYVHPGVVFKISNRRLPERIGDAWRMLRTRSLVDNTGGNRLEGPSHAGTSLRVVVVGARILYRDPVATVKKYRRANPTGGRRRRRQLPSRRAACGLSRPARPAGRRSSSGRRQLGHRGKSCEAKDRAWSGCDRRGTGCDWHRRRCRKEREKSHRQQHTAQGAM